MMETLHMMREHFLTRIFPLQSGERSRRPRKMHWILDQAYIYGVVPGFCDPYESVTQPESGINAPVVVEDKNHLPVDAQQYWIGVPDVRLTGIFLLLDAFPADLRALYASLDSIRTWDLIVVQAIKRCRVVRKGLYGDFISKLLKIGLSELVRKTSEASNVIFEAPKDNGAKKRPILDSHR